MVEKAVGRQDDMAVVGRGSSLEHLVELARETEPDVVVVGLERPGLPRDCLALLLDRPRVRILGIEAHEGLAWLYELRPEQIEIGEVSPEEVVGSIRDAARRQAPI